MKIKSIYTITLGILMVGVLPSCSMRGKEAEELIKNRENIAYLIDWSDTHIFSDKEIGGVFSGRIVGNRRIELIPFDWSRFGYNEDDGIMHINLSEDKNRELVYISNGYSTGIVVSADLDFGFMRNKLIWRKGRVGFYNRNNK